MVVIIPCNKYNFSVQLPPSNVGDPLTILLSDVLDFGDGGSLLFRPGVHCCRWGGGGRATIIACFHGERSGKSGRYPEEKTGNDAPASSTDLEFKRTNIEVVRAQSHKEQERKDRHEDHATSHNKKDLAAQRVAHARSNQKHDDQRIAEDGSNNTNCTAKLEGAVRIKFVRVGCAIPVEVLK